eukprot:TRINITY_DN4498_c2_g1_i1.p1 TRINITY_DN4498_c2_g1~~TRINITY_DN4498_c2_g1_i1.p1  ORF type:complete len:644 (-),score=89.29 TRINITY_DN4498_c2_g1_i1:428-2299(-)
MMSFLGSVQRLGVTVVVVCLAMQPHLVSAAGGSIWHLHEHEYNFVECVTLIVLVALALVFEMTWHHLSHSTYHSYMYGELHEGGEEHDHGHSAHGVRHVRLFKELWSRMGGEFMSLGFLAFCIFVSNQFGFFDLLAERIPSCNTGTSGSSASSNASVDELCWHMPATAGDWLHMAEVVHVKLFLAMMMYFVLMSGLVRGTVRKIKTWERLRLRHVGNTSRHTVDAELNEYRVMRDYFCHRVYLWKRSRPELFRHVLDILGIEAGLVDTKASIHKLMDEKFVMSAYLSLNVERNVRDSIEVSAFTWISIIVVFGMFAAAHRYLHWTILEMTPFFIVFAFCILMAMVVLSRWMKRKIRTYMKLTPSKSETPNDHKATPTLRFSHSRTDNSRDNSFSFAEGLYSNLTGSGRFSLDMNVMRVLQLLMFLMSYAFARTIADKNDWEHFAVLTLLTSSLFAVLFMFLLYIIPKYVPKFLELMAFPPFVDGKNLKVLFAILTSEHYTHKSRDHTYIKPTASTDSRSKINVDDALAAVSELADIISDCDPAELGNVRRMFEERMEDKGVRLPAPSTCKRFAASASFSPEVSTLTVPSEQTYPSEHVTSECARVSLDVSAGVDQKRCEDLRI